jgi:NTE family protein
MKKSQRKKIGLALGSGGVKGLSHIGVIKALLANNIPIDYVAGTSMGALIGAAYCAYQDIDKVEQISRQTNWRRIFSLFDPGWRGGLIQGRKVDRLLREWFNGYTFENLKTPLTIIATDLLTGQGINLFEGDIVTAIRASSAVPPVFKPIELDNYLLSDGGLVNPVPVKAVKEMGADIVIAVNLDSGRFASNLLNKRSPLSQVSVRALNIIRHYLTKSCLVGADIIIEPDVGEIGLIGWNKFFDQRQANTIIKLGQTAAEACLPEIKKYV